MDDSEDDEFPVDMLEKLQRLELHDARICTPQEEPKVGHVLCCSQNVSCNLITFYFREPIYLRYLAKLSYICSNG